MYTLTIMDRDSTTGCLSVELADFLKILAPKLDDMDWLVSGLEAIGLGADGLHEIERQHRRISTSELERLASQLDQVIDGEFVALERQGATPVFRLCAVDGSSWDASTDRLDLLDQIRRSFVSAARTPFWRRDRASPCSGA